MPILIGTDAFFLLSDKKALTEDEDTPLQDTNNTASPFIRSYVKPDSNNANKKSGKRLSLQLKGRLDNKTPAKGTKHRSCLLPLSASASK